MGQKFWLGFVVVFVVVSVVDYIVNMVLMAGLYDATKALWRPMEETKIWLIYVCEAFFAFFFTLIFAKGYEWKGWLEGIRYGIYTSLLINVPGAYMTYATQPVPYALALEWFLYGTVKFLIAGILLALIYGTKESTPMAKQAA
jgi:hypothetical protein